MKTNKLLLIPAFLLLLSGCNYINTNEVNGYKYTDSELYSIGDFTYESANISKINLCWVAGSVTVKKSTTTSNLEVKENGSASLLDAQKMHYLIQDNTLYIQYCESMFLGTIPFTSKELTLTIPENISFNGDLVSSSLTFSDLALSLKSLNIDTVSGQITGSETLGVEDDIDIDSTSASISLTNVACPKIEVDSVSSNFNLSVCSNDTIKIDTVSGSSSISLLNDLGATIDFSTVSGQFTCSKQSTVNASGTVVGDGQSQISFSSVSGNLEI